ncbi:MAG TPA: hypothetical protein VKY92_20080, partial [Verrucomicrobiae bacterium]|nr:hypothetical protein [Verrucomicrobiae bacterium]
DIDGDRRPRGASSDIGADEFTTNAPPGISRLQRIGGNVQLTLTTFLGESYDLLSQTDPGPYAWWVLSANRPGTGAEIQIVDTNGAAAAKKFYKARLSP